MAHNPANTGHLAGDLHPADEPLGGLAQLTSEAGGGEGELVESLPFEDPPDDARARLRDDGNGADAALGLGPTVLPGPNVDDARAEIDVTDLEVPQLAGAEPVEQ